MKKLWLLLVFLITACNQQSQNPILGHWLEVMPVNRHIIQGITFNDNGSAQSIGMQTLQYESWKLENDKLTLSGKSIGNGQTIDFSETYDIIEISPETLKLGKFGMYQIEYKRVSKIPENVK